MSVPDPSVVDWVPLGGGGMASSLELDYAEITSDVTLTVTTEATSAVVVTGASINLLGPTVVEIEFYAPGWNNANVSSGITVLLYDGATLIGQIFKKTEAAVSGDIGEVSGRYRYQAAAGAHQWIIKAYATASGKIIRAGSGGAASYVPAYLRVVQALGIPGPLGPQGPQAAGSVIVVTNVSQLPPVPNNKDLAFVIIPGEGPIPIVYDSSLSRWISSATQTLRYGYTETGGMWSQTTATWSEIDATYLAVSRIWLPMGVWDAAGFKPQFRVKGSIRVTATPTNGLVRASYATSALNGSRSAFQVPIAAAAIGHSATNWKIADSGWLDVPAGYTVADYIMWSAQMSNSSGANQSQVINLLIDTRWTS
jgi:hypothetical protein